MAFASTVSEATDGQLPVRAAIYLDEETKTAFLVCRNLPEVNGQSEYKLVVVGDEGETGAVLAKFDYTGGLVGAKVPVDVRLTSGGKLGLVPASGGSPVMISL